MSGYMMSTTIPTPGTNKLTERLLAQGVKLDDCSTWPEGVWAGEIANFCYSREYRFTPTWESPCGLLIHKHGDMWGETWVEGEFKCAENDNPLFGCPIPGKPCPHRKATLPAGINCQFHRTDREWNEADSVERLERERENARRQLWEDDCAKYQGWNGICVNLKAVDMPDGTVCRSAKYKLWECISVRCDSVQCVCRCGAKRDLRPANIFYDLYIERRFNEDLVPYSDKKVLKGLKVFDKPVAWTDVEIALKIWRHDPDSTLLPVHMRNKLNAVAHSEFRTYSKEAYFVRHHQYYDGHTNVELYIEIRNIRIGRNEQRDILQDLADVRAGVAVTHVSDSEKAAKAKKSQRRHEAKVKKIATIYAKETERGNVHGTTNILLGKERPEFRQAVQEEAERITKKREAKEKKEAAKNMQISIFDELEET